MQQYAVISFGLNQHVIAEKTAVFHRHPVMITQLFDSETDPWELNNLADDPAFVGQKTELENESLRWRTELGD